MRMLKSVSGMLLGAFVALAGCTVGPGPGSPSAETAAASTAAVPTGGFGAMLNAQRAAGGLPLATADARLTAVAQAHADDMVAQNYFSHTGLDGRSSADRVRAAGYSTCRPSEDIAFGQRSEAEVFQTWVASPPHLANIMMRGPVQYGFGQAGTKWVLVVAGVC